MKNNVQLFVQENKKIVAKETNAIDFHIAIASYSILI